MGKKKQQTRRINKYYFDFLKISFFSPLSSSYIFHLATFRSVFEKYGRVEFKETREKKLYETKLSCTDNLKKKKKRMNSDSVKNRKQNSKSAIANTIRLFTLSSNNEPFLNVFRLFNTLTINTDMK